ncbi:hypothetical protein GGE07_006297 [Sinorhizobium terangae]|nr:hypothetical protein [Sinorhizobium terangae]
MGLANQQPDPCPPQGAHMWTPPWQYESGTILSSVGCSHMFGLSMRSVEPLALMNLRGLDP